MTEGVAAYHQAVGESLDAQIVRYTPLVKRIAYHLVGRLPSSVQVDDLIQSGMIGLLEAIQKFDVRQGASFETYASIRIRGSMIDEIRKGDWTPRSVHRKARQISAAIQKVEKALGREARDHEVAEALEMTLEEYHHVMQDAVSSQIFSIDSSEDTDFTEDRLMDDGHGPLDNLQKTGFQYSLGQEVAKLPEKERLVLSLYYDEELNLREIGEVLGVSESRVCQIHSQALLRVRSRMKDWF
jgi:RNA polymerase sigma factor for flagellar operon FliA